MKKLNQYHFYYGAILNAVLECNLDASPTLLEVTDKRGVYKIIIRVGNFIFLKKTKNVYKSIMMKNTLFLFIFYAVQVLII